LTQDGVDAWLDKAKLLPGQDWELEIRKAVREADVVVVCLSKQFNQAGFRQKEVRLALDTAMEKPEGEIFIIPARLEECETLESLRRWHWVDLFEDDGYEMLIRALRARAGRIGATLQVPSNANKLKRGPDEEEIDRKTAEKAEQERKRKLAKLLKVNDRRLEAAKRKHKWDMFFLNIRRSLRLFFMDVRFKFLPILFVLIAIGAFVFMVFYLQKIVPALTIDFNPTSQPSQILTETFVPTTAVTVSPPLTESSVSVATSVSTEITDAKDVSMVLVPAGEFYMGSSCHEAGCVYKQGGQIDFTEAYWIDITEVANAKYAECVNTNICTPPAKSSLSKIQNYYGNTEYDNYPVVNITFEQAESYCNWLDGRLPTNKEWEKAARGTDGRGFPWGNDFQGFEANSCDVNCSDPNSRNSDLNDSYKYTAPVNSYSLYPSPYGTLNMAGNVMELVEEKDIRGGAWNAPARFLWTFNLDFGDAASSDAIGFRCAADVTP
jgi:formylglycine-generating enzyme required for sulfatase activity